MIDAFSELKEQDEARYSDKKDFCYICGMPTPEVYFDLFRWKKVDQTSMLILLKDISFGTTSITCMCCSRRILLTLRGWSL